MSTEALHIAETLGCKVERSALTAPSPLLDLLPRPGPEMPLSFTGADVPELRRRGRAKPSSAPHLVAWRRPTRLGAASKRASEMNHRGPRQHGDHKEHGSAIPGP
ncbi:hypothetical protein COCON_G00191390 [Conger conger]|uniref:Uncharacterized protein n=1 Tax=Conger conger TaxID=82655 RepID=A0A9Q1D3N8_CONCO|nr:hypothetical protein COCON_G00191390 [Conger conger]